MRWWSACQPSVSLPRLARQTPVPSGARGPPRPQVRPGPPPQRLSTRRPSSCTAKRTFSLPVMHGQSLWSLELAVRTTSRFRSCRLIMLAALTLLDTRSVVPARNHRRKKKSRSTRRQGSAVINVGQSGHTTRSSVHPPGPSAQVR
ncbi:hypothetical protein K466DRAFT_170393 [Polyporus arcularius HHB13444]|uniref:Uncharacterized protein n=1 Tax=Polyporus arcularius HHB13444 TaxID=1314778 RepID=A0A5C3P8L5_9APHY|nr:hypothetical protein K466DRAFT_170393 [Polyporus arcularius HHB13444]